MEVMEMVFGMNNKPLVNPPLANHSLYVECVSQGTYVVFYSKLFIKCKKVV